MFRVKLLVTDGGDSRTQCGPTSNMPLRAPVGDVTVKDINIVWTGLPILEENPPGQARVWIADRESFSLSINFGTFG